MIERVPKLFLQIVQNRLELLSVELQEEKARLSRMVVLLLFGATFVIAGIIGLGILIVYLAAADDRLVVGFVVVGVLLLAGFLFMVISRALSQRHTPFEATLATFHKDIYET